MFSGFIKARVLTNLAWLHGYHTPLILLLHHWPSLFILLLFPLPPHHLLTPVPRLTGPNLLFCIYACFSGGLISLGAVRIMHTLMVTPSSWTQPLTSPPLLNTDIWMPNRTSEHRTDLLNSSTSQTTSALILPCLIWCQLHPSLFPCQKSKGLFLTQLYLPHPTPSSPGHSVLSLPNTSRDWPPLTTFIILPP